MCLTCIEYTTKGIKIGQNKDRVHAQGHPKQPKQTPQPNNNTLIASIPIIKERPNQDIKKWHNKNSP